MLQRLYELKVYNQTDGSYLCFLINGDNSHLKLPFLQYTNDEVHKWCAYIGIPYGTHIWQVGDSKDQNGGWKHFTTECKNTLLEIKRQLGMDSKLTKTDIIPHIANPGYKASFSQVDMKERSIASRGFNPLNRAHLIDLEIFFLNLRIFLTIPGWMM